MLRYGADPYEIALAIIELLPRLSPGDGIRGAPGADGFDLSIMPGLGEELPGNAQAVVALAKALALDAVFSDPRRADDALAGEGLRTMRAVRGWQPSAHQLMHLTAALARF